LVAGYEPDDFSLWVSLGASASGSQAYESLKLTARAIESAPPSLLNASDGCSAPVAGLAFPVVNPQSFLVVIGRPGREAEVKKTVTAFGEAVIEGDGAPEPNGFFKH